FGPGVAPDRQAAPVGVQDGAPAGQPPFAPSGLGTGGAPPPPPFAGGAPGPFGSAGTTAWVTANCAQVPASAWRDAAPGGGAARPGGAGVIGGQLYDC